MEMSIVVLAIVGLIIFRNPIGKLVGILDDTAEELRNDFRLDHNKENIRVRNELCKQGEIVANNDLNDLFSGMYELPEVNNKQQSKYKLKAV